MPWEVKQDPRCGFGKPWAVIKTDTDKLVACHPTKEAAARQQSALYASERKADMTLIEERAEWDAAYQNDLPDSSFACIDAGGEKDENGRTTPRSLRHYPHHDVSGALDLPHLRNALARVRQEGTTSCGREHLEEHARVEGIGERAAVPYEVRAWPVAELEVREDQQGMHFRGYAAVFNVDSEPRPYIEQIRPGAFARTLKHGRDIRMFLNHNQDLVLASRKAGTLKLEEDAKGLLVDADLPDTSYARDLAVIMKRGDVDTMSFGFRVPSGGDEWQNEKRFLKQVNLFEVSPITGFPGYSQTSAYIRSLADWVGTEAEPLAEALRIMTNDHGRLTDDQVCLLESVINAHRADPLPLRRQAREEQWVRLAQPNSSSLGAATRSH